MTERSEIITRIPPQAVDLEEAVLGEMMIDKEALISALAILNPSVFYKEANQIVYRAIERMFRKSQPVDILTVTAELMASGELEAAGGPLYITLLTNRVVGGANVEYHCHILLQKYLAREMIRESSDLINQLYDDGIDSQEACSTMAAKLIDGFGLFNRRQISDLGTLAREVTQQTIHLSKNPKEIIGIPSQITALDDLTRGWQDTDLIVVAARPGAGKTALLITMAHNIGVGQQLPVGIFSLEMSRTQLARRILSIHSGIDHGKLLSGYIGYRECDELPRYASELDAPIYIDDSAALNIIQLRAKAIEMKRKYGVRIIFVDYLQLMSGIEKSTSREQEISKISRGLKGLAKELEIPVIALSQLNRETEKNPSKKPNLSNLRESGAIEQDADQVIFIFRPSMYDIEGVDPADAYLMVAKNRNGACHDAKVEFISERMMFRDCQEMPPEGFIQYRDKNIF